MVQLTEGFGAQAAATVEESTLDRLATHIRNCWTAAQKAKIPIEEQILKNRRQIASQYDPDKLAQITALKAPPIYAEITNTKSRNCVSWLKDKLIQPNSKPWDIEPTPVPELPPELVMMVTEKLVEQHIRMMVEQSAAAGMPIDQNLQSTILQSTAQQLPEMKKQIKKEVMNFAKEQAKEIKQKLDDELVDGDWYKSLSSLLPRITEHTGVLKGPVKEKRTFLTIKKDGTGRSVVTTEERVIKAYYSLDPLDIYPAPDSTGIHDTYLIEKASPTALSLQSLLGVEGYRDDEIMESLADYRSGGLREWTSIDSERLEIQNRGDVSALSDTSKMDMLIYWGSVQGEKLIEWGMDKKLVPDSGLEYNICAYLIGKHVVGAVINPDPLGKKPYAKLSFEEVEGAFWGRGLPEEMWTSQQICNACARYIALNIAFGAGPVAEIDKNRLAPGETPEIWPFKVILTEDPFGTGKPAVQWNIMPMIADKLIRISQAFSRIADEQPGIPSNTNPSGQGATDTASGYSMFLSVLARGMESVVKEIDAKIITDSISRHYYSMLPEMDVSLIADMRIVAKGSSSLLAKEQQAVRRTEWLRETNNPVDMAIIGMEGRKNVLMETAQAHDFDLDKTFPENPSQMPLAANMPPTESPANLLPSGQEAGGAANRTFTNYQGT